MIHSIPPDVQAKIAEGVAWLWGQYGQKLVEKVGKRASDETKWRWSIEKYYTSLFERVGFVRVLGRMEAEPLENVFTHVNVLDKVSAERRYDVARLMAEFAPRDFSWTERVKRVPGDKAAAEFPKLFILGKPGAGKTTFLKHTALRAIKHEIKKVPVFVTLKELSDSGMEIVPFIVHQFTVHQLPEAAAFVEPLLKNGNALVLFDGLDEVNLEGNKRADLIRALNDFVYQYSDCPMMLTCRVAATDYSFTQFEYVEMADFDEGQMGHYIDRWFVGDTVKRDNCRQALLHDAVNKPVRELAQVPLLLALLCLVYEERGEFPPNRDEIYDEATRALLVKWDSSRNIVRDTVYRELSLKHKQKMLARIAAETFSAGEYFLAEKRVVTLIETYLGGVPGLAEPDGEHVLKAMEAQHGIFVERAWGIHSFSHLTLQEYFAARYIVDNEQRGTVAQLMRYVGDDRWREVFKLTAGMLGEATEFFEQYLAAVPTLLQNDSRLLALLQWGVQKSA
ncbi:MAG: NACHT domain-containing protein [Chloroflexota bacterium]